MTTGNGEPYVTASDIGQAIKGHEAEILDVLGIPWRRGRPHINCPFPDHPDKNPSWRFDEGSGRAFCTCACGSYSMLDVLMKVEGISFDAAKIRAAEILRRQDLIRVATGNKRHQRQDVRSLLNPPDENRDDDLPFIYLASRLGVDPTDVPHPETTVVGLESLGYFDPPPPGSRAKPKLVGSWPCAVFLTAAADGRRHAHRIYLSPDGRAKADLGIGPDGQPRDPKKSAKRADGQPNISGCAVIWGDPEVAPHLVLLEGIENAAAGAHDLRAEIAAAEVYIASAINAGGVEAFVPWPGTKLVTIGADRDEAKDGAGNRRGEKAARKFALRQHETVEVRIALPGADGESIDWLDILRRDGAGAVRSGLLSALPFVPSDDEVDESRQKKTQAQYLKEIAKTYPLPQLETLSLEYRPKSDSEIWVYKLAPGGGERGTGEEAQGATPVCSPFGVTAVLSMADSDGAYWLRVLVQDMDGQPRAIDLDRAELARLNATEILARLLEEGLRIEADGHKIVVRALKAAKPSDRITVFSRPGWHKLPDEPAFITPAGETIGGREPARIELAAPVKLPDRVARSGTIEGWQAAVRAAATAENCPHWTLGIASGFAGVIVGLTDLDTCGLNVSGKTSLGKTTTQQLAVSAWSSPRQLDGGLLKSMRSTENAVEVLARDSSSTILALDEMAHADGKVIGRMLYSLAGDVGKSRMRPDSSLRRPHTWSTVVLLSGEKSLEQKIREDGGRWTGGMAVRFPDVDVTGVNPSVAPDRIKAIEEISIHYGHAGPTFVAKLVASGLHLEPHLLKDRVLAVARTLAGAQADSARIRAATPFAVVAIGGVLAQEYGILPTEADVMGAVWWAWGKFCDSADALALDPDRQAIINIRQYIAERWDVTVKDVKAPTGVNNREAVAWYDDDTVYLPTNRAVEAASGVLKEQRIAAVLDQGGSLSRRGGAKRIPVRYVPKVGHVDCYALRRSKFGRTDQDSDPNPLRMVAGDE